MHKHSIYTNGRSKPVTRVLRYRAVAFFAIILLSLPIGSKGPSNAAQNLSTSYITPFPEGGRYKLLVIGDAFAEGSWIGLSSAFKGDSKIEIYRDISYGASLLAGGRSSWLKRLDRVLSTQKFDIAVIMLGLSDRRKVKIKGKWYNMEKEPWKNYFKSKVREAIAKLRKKNIAVYWVGLPVVKGPKTSKAVQTINELIRAQTFSSRIKYIDQWLHFANEDGQFTQYGPDMSGKVGLLRSRDGIYFTRKGYDKLGHFVKNHIQRDLIEARAERDIPLLGGKNEQNYLLRRGDLDNTKNLRKRAAAMKLKASALLSKDSKSKRNINPLQRTEYETANHSIITLEASKTIKGKAQQIKIVRPPIPAAAFSVTRRSLVSSEGDLTNGYVLVEKLNELTGLAITSSAQNLLSNETQRRLPLTQTPYYKLLIRGDAQNARTGRADNFIWPEAPTIEGQSKSNNQ